MSRLPQVANISYAPNFTVVPTGQEVGQLLAFYTAPGPTAFVTLYSTFNSASGCDWYLTMTDSFPSSSTRTSVQCRSMELDAAAMPAARQHFQLPRTITASCLCKDCHEPGPEQTVCFVSSSRPDLCAMSPWDSTVVRVTLSKDGFELAENMVPVVGACAGGVVSKVCNGDGSCQAGAGEDRRSCPEDCICGG